MKPVTLLLADDHEIILWGLKRMLEDLPEVKVVGESTSLAEALSLLQELQPEVCLLDILFEKSNENSLDSLPVIHEKCPQTKVILLSFYDDEEYIRKAISSGVQGYALKDISREEIVRALHIVAEGENYLDPRITRKLLEGYKEGKGTKKEGAISAESPPLSRREVEVLKLLVTGLTNKEISRSISVSEDTTKSHLRHIFTKIGVSNRVEAVFYALKHHLVGDLEGEPAPQ